MLVPQPVGPARRVRELSDARQAGVSYPGSGQFRASIADAPADQRGVLERLADWADALDRDGLVRLSTYRGKSGMVSLLPRLASDNAGLVTVYNDLKSAYVQFWRGVFERRAPSSIPAVEAAAGIGLRQGNWTPQISDELLDALTHAYEEAVGQATGRPVPNEPTDKIVIGLTQGNLNNGYVYLGQHLGFFPADAIGAASAHDGQGVPLTVHFAGLPESAETDIAGGKDIFRSRGPWRKFFAHHALRPGDTVIIERLSAHEYRVVPGR